MDTPLGKWLLLSEDQSSVNMPDVPPSNTRELAQQLRGDMLYTSIAAPLALLHVLGLNVDFIRLLLGIIAISKTVFAARNDIGRPLVH